MEVDTRLMGRAKAIRKHIGRNWRDGKYTELHWLGSYVAKHPVPTPEQADDDVTLIGVYSGEVTTGQLLEDIECAMGEVA